MPDREKVIKGWECHMEADTLKCADCPYREGWRTCNFADTLFKDVYALLKEQEAVEPKTIPEELKYKMWNALYAEEDRFEKKYIGTDGHDAWFNTYRPWLQRGFEIAIKAIADWEGR